MDPEQITTMFTRDADGYVFARWGRPIAPNVFGVEQATLEVVKGALEAVVALAGHQIVETDPELGSNLMVFFFRDWSELTDVPGMEGLVPELAPLVDRLEQAGANQYRLFRFDPAGAIKACFVFLRMDDALSALPAQTLALSQMVQSILLWSDAAFRAASPLAVAGGTTILRPDVAALVRAAYDPVLPNSAKDSAHAYRIAARMRGAM